MNRSPLTSERGAILVHVAIGLLVLFIVLIANAAITYRSGVNLVEHSRDAAYALNVSRLVVELQARLVDAETSQRGFIITGNADYVSGLALRAKFLARGIHRAGYRYERYYQLVSSGPRTTIWRSTRG